MPVTGNNIKPEIARYDETLISGNQKEYALNIQLGSEGLYCCILDKEPNTMRGFIKFAFPPRTSVGDIPGLFITAWESDEAVAKLNYSSVNIAYTGGNSILIPGVLFDSSDSNHYWAQLNRPDDDQVLLTDKIKMLDAFSVFTIPQSFEMVMRKNFPGSTIHHHSSSLIESVLLEHKNASDEILTVNIRSSCFDILVNKGRNLVFHNSYSYQSPEDYVYFILHVCEKLGLNTEKVKVVMIGEVARQSAIHNITLKYLRQVTFGSRPGLYKYSYIFEDIPAHFYFGLFSQELCGS
jgi:hypothetical protein